MGFYSHHVFVCTNQRPNGEACCAQADAQFARQYLKDQLKAGGHSGAGGCRVSSAGCLGRCEDGPLLVIYPEAVWYRYVDEADLDEILQRHLLSGEVVERLQL